MPQHCLCLNVYVLHVYVGHSMILVIMPVHRPPTNVVANPRQKVLHCLVASRTLPAEGKKARLQVSVFMSHTLLWRLADQVLCDECMQCGILSTIPIVGFCLWDFGLWDFVWIPQKRMIRPNGPNVFWAESADSL